MFKIVFQTADFNDKHRKTILIKEVQECFGDHNVVRKDPCKNHPEFMICEIEILSSQPVRAQLLEGKLVPLPAKFCLLNKRWKLLDSQNMTFIDLPQVLN